MNSLVTASSPSTSQLELLSGGQVSSSTPLEELIAAVYRQRFVLIIAVGVGLLAAAIFSLASPKQYTAVASVQLEQQTPRVFKDGDLDPETSIQDSDRFLQTQLDLVSSHSIAESVADKLGLAKSPKALKALEVEAPTPADVVPMTIYALQEKVVAKIGLNTRLAKISFTSGEPEISARIANGYADALTEANIDGKLRTSDHARKYLLEQMAGAKQRLESSEEQMLAYARKADLTTTVVPTQGPNDRGGSLRSQQLGLMTDSLSQATTRRIDAEQRWRQVQDTPALALPEVESNKAIQDLVSQKAQLQASLEEERQKHTDAYPTVREAAAKIAMLDSQINNFGASIKSSFRGQYLAAAQQERQMTQTVGQLRGAAMSERERSVGYNSLNREVETNRAFYDGLLQRYKEIAAASGAATANVSLVDAAWPPSLPDPSNLIRNLALGGMAGLIFALFIGGVRERVHHVVRSTSDLENRLLMPALGVVPRFALADGIQGSAGETHSAQAEAYHSIAVALEGSSPKGLPKTLLITSTSPSEGKSTSALGIARSLSAMGKRVLLVDGDLRHPSATTLTNGLDKPGFSEVLAGSSTPDKSIDRNASDTFGIVRAGDVKTSPVTLLAVDRIKTIFDRLASKHDIVIIDGPPIMGLADAVLLARSVEAVLVVVEANRTHVSEVDVAISRLSRSNVVGGVLTKFNAKSAGVRYGGTDYYTYRPSESVDA